LLILFLYFFPQVVAVMSSDPDGDLIDVNKQLLELCKDPVSWKEQRKKAMREKIFGHSSSDQVASPGAQQEAHQYMPGHSSDGAREVRPALRGDEEFVMQQLKSHKRQRQEVTHEVAQEVRAPATSSTQAAPSGLRAKLFERYGKSF
jgi:hypothetical protein